MAEIAPGNGKSNRTFLFIVGGLAAMLVIGLVVLGAAAFLPGLLSPAPAKIAANTPTVAPTRVVVQNTPTPAATPTEVEATPTRVVDATATLAPAFGKPVSSGGGTTTSDETATTDESLPSSGFGQNLWILGGGLALLLVALFARRMRLAD